MVVGSKVASHEGEEMECEAESVVQKEVECEGGPSTGIRPRGSLWWRIHVT